MKIKSNSIVGIDLEGKILVIKELDLAKIYRTLGNRLWRATGGFGCDPSSIGNALFATCISDGEKSHWTRDNFEGWLTEEEANELIKREKELGKEEFLMWQELSGD